MSFAGSDAVDWFMANMEGVDSLEVAVTVGNRLLDLRVITNIQVGCSVVNGRL